MALELERPLCLYKVPEGDFLVALLAGSRALRGPPEAGPLRSIMKTIVATLDRIKEQDTWRAGNQSFDYGPETGLTDVGIVRGREAGGEDGRNGAFGAGSRSPEQTHSRCSGPGKQIFMVDHHHLARALWSLKMSEAVLGDQLAGWSGLEIKAFWRMMESKGYCWPIDADGNRRPYAAIPKYIADLTDNAWRTLARHVRGQAF